MIGINRHYVEFLYPGIIVSETSVKELKEGERDNIQMPDGAFGYRFFEVMETKTDDGEVLKSKRRNVSNWYYEGKKLSLVDVETLYPKEKILISNMRNNNWMYVVKTKFGQFIPFLEGDVVL